MPSKKRKYNARFPAGRIKKIMQTDEEVGKVAQAVPIIISRTLELFVESLLSKAMQVTVARNAKTLSPSHVKQCILAESRFDFLRDLVKNIPDVSAAEEKEVTSAENSPNSSRFSDLSVPRRIVREDSNSSSSSADVRVQQIIQTPRDNLTRAMSVETEAPNRTAKTETVTSTIVSTDAVMDLSKKPPEESKPIRTANFYQETLLTDDTQHRSVIKINPTYTTNLQPSTSTYTTMTNLEPIKKIEIPVPKHEQKPLFYVGVRPHVNNSSTNSPLRLPIPPLTPIIPNAPVPPATRTPITPMTPRTPVTPILNIDFTKNIAQPEIKVLDTSIASMVGVKNEVSKNATKSLQRQNSKPQKSENKKPESKPVVHHVLQPVDIDHLNSGNLQIDEDYDT